MWGSNPTAGLNGLSSLLATIQKLYPQAQVTSGYRGPNNPLTQRNPASLHAQGTPQDPNAVDVAPIPGVNFNDYVASIKKAGVPVAQAFDEQKHPFAWTTGPNWHIGQGQGQAMPPYYPQRRQQPRTLADIIPKPVLDAIPVDTGANMQAPMTLGQVAQGQIAGMPTPKVPGYKGLLPGKDLAGIIGILGDALSAYGGQQPIFGPAMYRKQQDQRAEQADLEKFRAALAAKQQEQPQWLQDAISYNNLSGPQRQAVLSQRDAMYPVTAINPMTGGAVRVPRTMGGPPPEAVAELKSAVGKGDAAAIAEFEQVFGQGSASQYLGGQ